MRARTPPGSRQGPCSSTASSRCCRALLGIGYAFTDWNSYSTELHWVGLDNFATILSSSGTYVRFIMNTVVFTVVTIFLKTAIALGLAILLTQGIRRLAYLYRALIYLPAVLPILVVSLIFRSVLDPADGAPQRDAAGRGPREPGAALADGRLARDVERHRRRRLAGRRLHHGHPHRWSSGHPTRLLRGGVHRRRLRSTDLPAHHAAAPDAGPDRDHGAQPPVRPEGLRHRLRPDPRRTGPRHGHGLHGHLRRLLEGSLRRSPRPCPRCSSW